MSLGSSALGEIAVGDAPAVGRLNLYYPPRTLNKTQMQIIREVDPDWRPAMSGKDTEFVFSNGRKFERNFSNSGPYED